MVAPLIWTHIHLDVHQIVKQPITKELAKHQTSEMAATAKKMIIISPAKRWGTLIYTERVVIIKYKNVN